jgi:hypothetical protein
MPQKVATTHVLMANELVLYQRERSNVWQCRYKVDGVWQRATTKQHDLGKARAKARELMMEAEIRKRANLPFITRKFRHVAKLAIERMRQEVTSGRGKVSYADYERVIDDYLIPYFGNYSITNVDFAALENFSAWRQEQMGKAPTQSTLMTQNAALNRVFDEAVARGFMAEVNRPNPILGLTLLFHKRMEQRSDGELLECPSRGGCEQVGQEVSNVCEGQTAGVQRGHREHGAGVRRDLHADIAERGLNIGGGSRRVGTPLKHLVELSDISSGQICRVLPDVLESVADRAYVLAGQERPQPLCGPTTALLPQCDVGRSPVRQPKCELNDKGIPVAQTGRAEHLVDCGLYSGRRGDAARPRGCSVQNRLERVLNERSRDQGRACGDVVGLRWG